MLTNKLNCNKHVKEHKLIVELVADSGLCLIYVSIFVKTKIGRIEAKILRTLK